MVMGGTDCLNFYPWTPGQTRFFTNINSSPSSHLQLGFRADQPNGYSRVAAFLKRIFNELGLSAKRMEELFLSNAITLLGL